MGKDKKDKKADNLSIKPMNPKTGLIDAGSIREYKSLYTQYKAQNEKQANSQLEEHVQTRIHKTVDEQKKKRKRDITSVAASTAAGTMLPFSGIPIMVATTMVQCVGFSASLGLIPIANVRSFQDVNTLSTQLTSTLTKASSSGMKAAIEAFILEAIKVAGLGTWLWEEILKDVVFEITSGVVTEAAWVITPIFAAPKYILHRKLIKKMYVSLGEKAIVVHKAWVTDHLFLGKPETEKQAEQNVAAVAVAHPGFPTAYPIATGYPVTGQRLYESNSDQGVPYPAYYQPAFASSEHIQPHPHEAAPAHSNSFPVHHPHSQYAYYPPSYPMHMPPGQTNSSSQQGPQYQQYQHTGPPQQGTHERPSYAPNNYSQQPPGGYNPNPLVSHMHTNSTPNLPGPYGSSTNVSSDLGGTYSEVPPVAYPQQGQNGENAQYTKHSTPYQGGNNPASTNSAPSYTQAPPSGNYPPQYSYHGAHNPSPYPSGASYQQEPPTGSSSSHHGHSQSEPPLGGSAYPVQQSHFPSPYGPAAEQNLHQQQSYGTPPVQYQQHPAPGSYPQNPPPQRQAEPC